MCFPKKYVEIHLHLQNVVQFGLSSCFCLILLIRFQLPFCCIQLLAIFKLLLNLNFAFAASQQSASQTLSCYHYPLLAFNSLSYLSANSALQQVTLKLQLILQLLSYSQHSVTFSHFCYISAINIFQAPFYYGQLSAFFCYFQLPFCLFFWLLAIF